MYLFQLMMSDIKQEGEHKVAIIKRTKEKSIDKVIL